MADIESEGRGKRVSREALKFIHAGKTGALITASIEVGAMLGGADSRQRKALVQFGRHIGLAFQVSDDILNVVGDELKLGKKTGSDMARGKATYPSLFGLEKSREIARREWTLAGGFLRNFGKKAEPLAALARFVIERDH